MLLAVKAQGERKEEGLGANTVFSALDDGTCNTQYFN
jgi:hypothetical protein